MPILSEALEYCEYIVYTALRTAATWESSGTRSRRYIPGPLLGLPLSGQKKGPSRDTSHTKAQAHGARLCPPFVRGGHTGQMEVK